MKRKFTQLGVVTSLVFLMVLTFALAPKATNAGSKLEPANLKSCSNKTLTGRYVVFGSGTKALGGIGPISVVGWGDFDGNGSVFGNDTTSVNGEILRRSYTGSYQVNENCTGSISFALPAPRTFDVHFDFVIAEGGDSVQFIQTDPGTDLRLEARRQ